MFCSDNHHLLGDSGYFLTPWLLTPYERRGILNKKQKLYNKKLSGTRVLIENVFGLLKGRWRILKYIDVYSIEKAVKIIISCCILHNFCILNRDFYLDLDEPEEMPNNDGDLYVGDLKMGKEKRENICNFIDAKNK